MEKLIATSWSLLIRKKMLLLFNDGTLWKNILKGKNRNFCS